MDNFTCIFLLLFILHLLLLRYGDIWRILPVTSFFVNFYIILVLLFILFLLLFRYGDVWRMAIEEAEKDDPFRHRNLSDSDEFSTESESESGSDSDNIVVRFSLR